MHDALFQTVFWLVIGAAALGLVITAVAVLVHFAVFGLIINQILQRTGSTQVRPGGRRAELRCDHCRSVVAAGLTGCPNCGASLTSAGGNRRS